MSTPGETYPHDRIDPQPILPPATIISPDNPPYNLLSAIGVWLMSVALLVIANVIALAGYVLYKHGAAIDLAQMRSVLETDQRELIFVSLLGIIPAHLLTLLIIWAVVSQSGRYPFWQTIGWEWSPGMRLSASVAISLVMLATGLILTWVIGGGETRFDQMIASSAQARFATAFLATFTAPLVEEMVYRGVLFPALQRVIGAVWAVVAVAILFALVHVSQYSNNLGVISIIVLLSVVLTSIRAVTGRLLPCFTIHFVFNAVQAILLVSEPYLRPLLEKNKAPALLLAFQQLFST